MPNRSADWLRQAEADLRHARHATESEDFDWACFAAQQASEKAVKGLYMKLGLEAWGHTVSALMGSLPETVPAPRELIDCAKTLDKHYIPSRYPNGFDSGAPTDMFTRRESEEAIRCAERIIAFCQGVAP